MNQRQTQRLNAIISAFVENMKSFAEDYAASADEKDNAIQKLLQRESELLQDNDKLREANSILRRELTKALEKSKELEEKLEEAKSAPKIIPTGKYRQDDKRSLFKPAKGFRIEEK